MKYPRINLKGTDLLSRAGVIYSQILNDMLMKVEQGEDPDYPIGFFHTSTNAICDPNYYHSMWSRDVGRGIMETARAGFTGLSKDAADYILNNCLGSSTNFPDHYGRLISDLRNPDWRADYEVDGNVNILLGIYAHWKYSGKDKTQAEAYLKNADIIFNWFEKSAEDCPYGFLMPSISELSGNPDGPIIYAIYGTYGIISVLKAYADMAKHCGDNTCLEKYVALADRFTDGILEKLVSEGPHTPQNTKTPKGVWINGLNELNKAAEIGDFGPRFFIHRWTRQLPFVMDYDHGRDSTGNDKVDQINKASYEYLRDGMAEGYYFRRYGFVSCTCFGGMGDRHDDTMAGYAQNLFSQAALLMDDVNVYTKCIEGICRLAYDGDIVQPMTPDFNPWLMHECFTYENYEQGLDHTYGRTGDEENFIMHNPGDEGNLVQSAETLKTFAILAGISSDGDVLEIKPRLPWECTEAEIIDFPVVLPDGSSGRISYKYQLNRWKNEYILSIEGTAPFKEVLVRMGPLPYILCNEKELISDGWDIKRHYQASFLQKSITVDGRDSVAVTLINEKAY